ncbi:MAG: amino acid ABC transporter ATP-binding protein, partial [Clostridia bacterium]|nr:amino acid ABC transporter ATP-binding protein [Clostridia bacterium]
MIELIHLEKKYGEASPLRDVNAVIRDGDVISVIGPSGTGKSTLLRCINMLERPTGGRILLDGEDITAPKYDLTQARRRMGMVFQSFNLFGHLTVIENLMLAPVDILKKSRQEAYDTGIALLRRVGLAGRELQYPEQLSGGQKQRVAIARTLAMDPDVILLDEPTSALDPTMVGEVQTVVRDLTQTGKTMLIVTHEMSFARAISNRVFYMDGGEIC